MGEGEEDLNLAVLSSFHSTLPSLQGQDKGRH